MNNKKQENKVIIGAGAVEQQNTRKQSYCRGRVLLNNKTPENKVIVGAGGFEQQNTRSKVIVGGGCS